MDLQTNKYRPDIDGLRALAVLAVVLYHAFPSILPGGFAGVDVFFVISGFLISGILLKEIEEGRFSIRGFYARRIRRIFPALVVVLLAVAAAGGLILFSEEYKHLGRHLIRAAVFLSNFILWKESGYFDLAAELKPLLHLWSLAIEEQFYIIWPLLMWLLWRFTRKPIGWLWLFTGASFFWNLYQAYRDPTHAFYSPLTRFWELWAGALLAAHVAQGKSLPQAWKKSAGVVGALLLVVCMWAVSLGEVYPGIWAAPVVVGAVLLIGSEGANPRVQTLFASQTMVKIGLMSYPLYLWHWPVLSFLRIVEGQTPGWSLRLAGVLLSVILAALTVRYVERPFRSGGQVRWKLGALISLMVVVALVGHWINQSKGFPQRKLMSPEFVANQGEIGHPPFLQGTIEQFHVCPDAKLQADTPVEFGIRRCYVSRLDKPVEVVLLGDSHAEHLFPGLAKALPDHNVAFYGRGGLPLLSAEKYKVVYEHVLNDASVRTVVVVAEWSSHLRNVDLVWFEAEMEKTVKALHERGLNVVLADDILEFDFDPQLCKYKRPFKSSTLCEVPRSELDKQSKSYTHILDRVASHYPGTGRLNLADYLCDSSKCVMAGGGVIYYRDRNHLTLEGSKLIGERLATDLTPYLPSTLVKTHRQVPTSSFKSP